MYSFGFQQAFRRGIQTEDRVYVDKVRDSSPTQFRSAPVSRMSCNDSGPITVLPGCQSCHCIHGRWSRADGLHALCSRQ